MLNQLTLTLTLAPTLTLGLSLVAHGAPVWDLERRIQRRRQALAQTASLTEP